MLPGFCKLSALTLMLEVLLLLFPANANSSTDQEMMDEEYTVILEPLKTDCYHLQTPRQGLVLDVLVKVVRGGDGATGILVYNPYSESRPPYHLEYQYSYSKLTDGNGEYVICLENADYFAEKVVFFSAATSEMEEKSDEESDFGNPAKSSPAPWEVIEDIDSSLSRIQHLLRVTKQVCSFLRITAARSISSLEALNYNVFVWSSLQCSTVLIAGTLHVYFIRKLFKLHSR